MYGVGVARVQTRLSLRCNGYFILHSKGVFDKYRVFELNRQSRSIRELYDLANDSADLVALFIQVGTHFLRFHFDGKVTILRDLTHRAQSAEASHLKPHSEFFIEQFSLANYQDQTVFITGGKVRKQRYPRMYRNTDGSRVPESTILRNSNLCSETVVKQAQAYQLSFNGKHLATDCQNRVMLPELLESRAGHGSCIMGARLYVFGGFRDTKEGKKVALNSFEWIKVSKLSSIQLMSWASVNLQVNIPGRYFHVFCPANDRQILIYGGWDNRKFYMDAFLFDIEDQNIKQIKSLGSTTLYDFKRPFGISAQTSQNSIQVSAQQDDGNFKFHEQCIANLVVSGESLVLKEAYRL